MSAAAADSPVLVEVWRGDILESVHRGRVAVCRADGTVVEAMGAVSPPMLPRSASKMLQALALVESGAADAEGLTDRHLALACASHRGQPVHTDLARSWLARLGLGDADLRCGAHAPTDKPTRAAMAAAGEPPEQVHNNCSGKHCGFLTLTRHLGAGPDYIALGHPVQTAVRAATEEMAGERADDFAIDGCSAPNFALSLTGFATALARMAAPAGTLTGARAAAADRLRDAMAAHPRLIAGDGQPATVLTAAAEGQAVIKSGAEGVYAAMLPARGLGIALKIDDGSDRGAQAAIAALLARYGVLEARHPAVQSLADAPIHNWRGIAHGHIRASAILRDGPAPR